MIYDVKCTHCISLLKNWSKLKDNYFFMQDGEMYVEVNDNIDKELIEKIEYHQSNTYWYYNRLQERS